MKVSFVVAMSLNKVIGKDGGLPWHIPEDLKFFYDLTRGHRVIMGRKTFDSIGHPLSDRENIVISTNRSLKIPQAVVCNSIEEVVVYCENLDKKKFVIGGATIFKEFFPLADEIYLTVIHQEILGDVYFPNLELSRFHETSRKDFDGNLPYSFLTLKRS
jgi:dihydrofolate reductase